MAKLYLPLVEENNLSIKFTERATEAILLLIKKHQITNPYVRVGVKAFNGLETNYLLAFDLPADKDIILDFAQWKVLVSLKDQIFVMGLEIDWVKKGNDLGFVFLEPKR